MFKSFNTSPGRIAYANNMTTLMLLALLAADGELAFPKDYREWVYLSSGLGMTYGPAASMANNNPMWDNVFVKPESWKAFKETGTWPEGTTFVLEIRYATSQGSINKGGHYQTDVAAIEASQKRGGQWQYFGFGNGLSGIRPAASPLPAQAGCAACHSANGAVEWTFTQFYPAALAIAQAKGTVRATYQPPVPSPAALFHTVRDAGWSKAVDLLAAAKQKDPSAAIVQEATLNSVGYALQGANRTEDAIALFNYVTRQFPQSANAFDSLAEVLEAAGRKPEALEASRKVLALGSASEQLTKINRERVKRLGGE